MKLLRVRGLLGLLTALAVSVFLAGCAASVPPSATPDSYDQEKAQAVEHWRVFAEDMAENVRLALLERHDLVDKPIYVQPPNASPFLRTMHELLKTEIVSRGIPVTELPEADTVVVGYDVILVKHDPAAPADSYGKRSFPDGSGISRHEAVVNISMRHRNRYVLHLSYIRYINDADWMLYTWPETAVAGKFFGGQAGLGGGGLYPLEEALREDDIWTFFSRRGMAYPGQAGAVVIEKASGGAPVVKPWPSSGAVLSSTGGIGRELSVVGDPVVGRRIDPNSPPTPFPGKR